MGARICLSIVLAALAVTTLTGTATAAGPLTDGSADGSVSATLEGDLISLGELSDLPCHDFEYPVIRCFTSASRLFADVSARTVRQGLARSRSTAASTGYVVAYDQFNYGGSNPKVLSSDQPWLVLIGWNDVTSSFKSFGATGRWWENSPNGGFVFAYGAATQVPVLSSTYNNKFSAFEIN